MSISTKTLVSVLFNEPKLLKYKLDPSLLKSGGRFSALQRAEIAEIRILYPPETRQPRSFSALQRAEIAEIASGVVNGQRRRHVSVLFNEPKLLKSLQAVIELVYDIQVSVLFNEPKLLKFISYGGGVQSTARFSALQRAEIAEIVASTPPSRGSQRVSVLFNEPKLLKWRLADGALWSYRVSVLFNEPKLLKSGDGRRKRLHRQTFQCSSTSRNC